jgi:amino acid transporter
MESFDSHPAKYGKRFFRKLFGNPKDINDPGIFHKIALTPIFAWIGLGADGLSSSAYGPEEAFRALGSHSYLSVFLVFATILTVTIISYSYSKIIEHFPNGGGGYVVATKMLGKEAGVISGSALIIDYILTITVSIVSCADAIFSYLPMHLHHYKIYFAAILILFMVLLNIRGAKESINILTPIFALFILTHLIMLGYGIISHFSNFSNVLSSVQTNAARDSSNIGLLAMFLIFIRAYSLGGGTYTGIEAVSNGLQIMRPPKVRSGKRTMLLMATSLSIAAGGLFLCYELVGVNFIQGKTLNAALADLLYQDWSFGKPLAFITIFSEGALLFVAAQAGFIDAPRVIANMSLDNWLPRKFSLLSERLTMRNGIMIIGAFALILLFYTDGSIQTLVVMYSINVFLTFTISQFAMVKFYFHRRRNDNSWFKHSVIFIFGLILCSIILSITVFEKFTEGGWITLLSTSILIAICFLIRNHYNKVKNDLSILEDNLPDLDIEEKVPLGEFDNKNKTAVQLVGNYDGFGIHTFFSIIRSFPGVYKNFVFVSVAVVDHELFKENENVSDLITNKENALKKYVNLANTFGFHAEFVITSGTDVVESSTNVCIEISEKYPDITVFTGKLAFRIHKFYHKVLHNEKSLLIMKNLQEFGITNVILPIRIGVKRN